MRRYLYKDGYEVLRNIPHIKDPKDLKKIERDSSTLRMTELSSQRLENFSPDYDGVKAVHKHLFQDVYEWAGKSRGEEVTIEGNTFTPESGSWRLMQGRMILATFRNADELEVKTPDDLIVHKERFDELTKDGHKITSKEFAPIAADLLGDINRNHPFREGNGRAMRGFLTQLGKHYDIEIDVGNFTKDEWVNASITAHNGDASYMEKLIQKNSKKMTKDHIKEWQANPIKDERDGGELSKLEKLGQHRRKMSVIEKAISKIKNPFRQKEAQEQYDQMQGRGTVADKLPKPETKQPAKKPRDFGIDD